MSYDIDPDALASALPAGITFELYKFAAWNRREIAAFQAERLAESGYRLIHTEHGDSTLAREESS